MASIKGIKTSSIIGSLLALVTVAVSLVGLFGADTYMREGSNWRVQAQAQDWIDLCLLVPVLLVSVFFSERGKRLASFLQGGILTFFVYTYLIYAFAVHFNPFFLLYCAGLGLSVYGLMTWFVESAPEAPSWFDTGRSTTFPWVYLLVNGVLFYLLWLSEDVPAMLHGTTPGSLAAGNFFTNPVHVLDYSLMLPAFLFAAFQLRGKKPLGYLLAPPLLCFLVCMAVNVAFLAWYMVVKQVSPSGPVPYVFAGLALLTVWALAYLMKGVKARG